MEKPGTNIRDGKKHRKGSFLALGLIFIAAGLTICGFFYHSAELTCSRADDSCTIVRTNPMGGSRTSFRLSSITGVEKTVHKKYKTSDSGEWHIALHTKDGDRHLTDYDTRIGGEMMDKNVKEINDFVSGNAAPTLAVRQDDRIIALASLPLLGVGILLLVLWRR
jgi:hypothetical protein